MLRNIETDGSTQAAVQAGVEPVGAYSSTPYPLVNRENLLHRESKYRIIKRAQDIFFSVLALVILLIPMLIIALVVYIDDPHGGPIFKQTRVGKDGKEFKFYKFRSMCVDAESMLEGLRERNEMDGPVFKIKDDPRITRVGKFLRKFSIDELPQFYNVLRGDMSLVGPRPGLPREVAKYGPYERQRLYVKPGLTCYWQIHPNRNQLSFADWMALDIKYIQERSFLTDWKIILKTGKTVFQGTGE